MNIREATALVQLYQACGSEVIRARARELVPELVDFEVSRGPVTYVLADADRWSLRAIDGEGHEIGRSRVVCSAANLEVYKADFAANFDLVSGGVTVVAERLY